MHTDLEPRVPDVPGATQAAITGESPFGGRPAGRRRVVRWGTALAILTVAIVAALVATRGSGEQATADDDDHLAMAAATDAAQPVRLTTDDARRIGITFAPAVVGPLTREIRTVGQVTFDETRVKAVSPKIDGWVERLHVDFTGQSVRTGAPLLAVYSPMLVSAQEELLLAARLVADVAGAEPDARADAAELLSSARRRLAFWDIPADDIARIERTGQVERTLTLRAPVSGFVVEKNVLEGQRIMAGETLYRIADLSAVWIEGEVFEQDLPVVRPGQRVVAELQALPGEEYAGRITYIYPTVDPVTRTARVRVELANPGLRLKPGMYATFRVAGAEHVALSVPRSAVLSTGERHLVFVRAADGALVPRAVEIGLATDDRIEILRGVDAGETVVASATFLLDAESNLGALVGGAASMPGMDMPAPTTPAMPPSPTPAPETDHSSHRE